MGAPGAHPASCTMGTGSFPGLKNGRGVTLTLHPLLVPESRKGRAIPLLPLWAVLPVQSLSACTRLHFTFMPSRSSESNPRHWDFFYLVCDPYGVFANIRATVWRLVCSIMTVTMNLEIKLLKKYSDHLRLRIEATSWMVCTPGVFRTVDKFLVLLCGY